MDNLTNEKVNESMYNDQLSVPLVTSYEPICECCGLRYTKIPALKNAKFINNWEVSLGYPIAVSFVIISSYCVFLFVHTKIIPWLQTWMILLMTVLMLLFIVSYFVGILEGPGYLPFYYPFRAEDVLDKPHITKSDIDLTGIVSTKEQFDYVKNQPTMHRVKFFQSARRIVIRPDHFCAWFATFIGKKNHKLFMLFNIWGFIYISLFFASSAYSFYLCLLDVDLMGVKMIICIIYMMLAFFFMTMTGSFSCETIYNLSTNTTSFEKMTAKKNKIRRRPRCNCKESWEEVFGPTSQWYTYCIPWSPYHNVDEYDIIYEHITDKML